MANPTTGFGFQPTRRIDGASPNAQLVDEQVIYSYSTKIHQFTPVIRAASGYIEAAGANDAPVLGVFMGVEYYDTALKQKIFTPAWLAPTATALAGSVVAKVVLATPMQLFKVRSSGTVITLADKGANAKLEAVAGDDATGISKFRLDQTTLNTTNTLPFQVWEILPTKGEFNNATLDNNIVEVLIVNNTVTSTTGKAA